jgi:PKD repeat protein
VELGFGDGATSTAQNPTHSYADSGRYNVSLTVTDLNGASSTLSHEVVVRDLPPNARIDDAAIHTTDQIPIRIQITDPATPDRAALQVKISSTVPGFTDIVQTLAAGTYTFNAGVPSLAAGAWALTLAVTDKDGEVGVDTSTLTVSAPGAVFAADHPKPTFPPDDPVTPALLTITDMRVLGSFPQVQPNPSIAVTCFYQCGAPRVTGTVPLLLA